MFLDRPLGDVRQGIYDTSIQLAPIISRVVWGIQIIRFLANPSHNNQSMFTRNLIQLKLATNTCPNSDINTKVMNSINDIKVVLIGLFYMKRYNKCKLLYVFKIIPKKNMNKFKKICVQLNSMSFFGTLFSLNSSLHSWTS